MALIDKASLLMVPSTYEAGKLYNVLPSGNRAPDSTDQNSGYDQTRADFDFDRGSNTAATRVNADGLIEKYRENLLTESNNFSDSDWSNSGISLTSGQEDPFGSNNAWRYLMSGSISASYLYQNNRTINANAMVLSFWVKSNTDSSQTFRATANSGSQSSPDFTATTEWKRFSWFFVSSSGNSNILLAYNPTTNVDLVIYGAQFEVGTIATDYLDSTSVTGKAGVLVDLPRINYDANGENGSLLLEPSRTNLIPHSEWFGSGSGWSYFKNVSVGNFVLSPEGKMNATELVFDGTSGGRLERSISGLISGADYSVSLYARVASGTQEVFFGSFQDAPAVTLTTEWQRLEKTQPENDTTAYPRIRCEDAATIEIYGFQHEAGSYPSSYIPNHSGTGGITRAADSCTGGGDSDSINSTEGVAFIECSFFADDVGENRDFYISDGTATNRIRIRFSSSDVVNFLVYNGSVQADINYTLPNPTNNNKIAVKWKANDFALWVNGTERGTDTSGTTFSTNTLDDVSFYTTYNQSQIFHSNVKQVAVFNEALSDSELATLTTL